MSTTPLSPTPAIPALAAADRLAVSAPFAEAKEPVDPHDHNPMERFEPEAAREALRALSLAFNASGTDLKFSVDALTGQTVVAVVRQSDGQVIRQVPSAVALRLAETLGQPLRGKWMDQTI